MKLSEIVVPGAIRIGVESADRDSVIQELVDGLVGAGAIDASLRDELVVRVLDREKRGTTGFGRGVAVPHAKHASVNSMAAAIGLSTGGVDFDSLDKQPVYSIFLMISPEDKPEEHLKAMEAIFDSISKETFRRFLRQATSVEDVTTLLQEADEQAIP